jgi:ribonuclease HII
MKKTPLKPFIQEGRIEAGLDEAGRGCLAGPVVVAAVILDPNQPIEGIDDSKKLTADQRTALAQEIKSKAIAWSVSTQSSEVIDKINVLQATFLGMHDCINQLETKPEFLLIDGNRFNPYEGIEHECIIKGDQKLQSIAAASILAKVHRDLIMDELDAEFPNYLWKDNKGYPTPSHRTAVMKYGPTSHHRNTFQIIQKKLSIPLK